MELLSRLRAIAEQVHIAMQSDDDPDPFRDYVIVTLIEFESDLDPKKVFRAVMEVANRSNSDALDALFRS